MEIDQLLQWIFFSCDLKIKNGFLQVASETLKSKMRKTACQEKLSMRIFSDFTEAIGFYEKIKNKIWQDEFGYSFFARMQPSMPGIC